MSETSRRWLSPVPGFCETCDTPLKKVFYDATTECVHGPWAIMCPSCFNLGPGIGKLGTALGQKYEFDGKHWIKTGG